MVLSSPHAYPVLFCRNAALGCVFFCLLITHFLAPFSKVKAVRPMATKTGPKVPFCSTGNSAINRGTGIIRPLIRKEESTMWTKPTYNDMRIGFEVTMYIANR